MRQGRSAKCKERERTSTEASEGWGGKVVEGRRGRDLGDFARFGEIVYLDGGEVDARDSTELMALITNLPEEQSVTNGGVASARALGCWRRRAV